MLDVIHFLVEEDIVVSRELAKSRGRFRTILYPDLYGSPYVMAEEEEIEAAEAVRNNAVDPSWEGVRVNSGAQHGLEAPMDFQPADNGFAPTPVSSYGSPSGAGRRGRVGAGVATRGPTAESVSHKPFIPPTDLSVSNNPYAPIRGLREAPMV